MKPKTWYVVITGIVLVLVIAVGCSQNNDNQNALSETKYMMNPVGDSKGQDTGLTVDSVNALGRISASATSIKGQSLVSPAGWQLYVSIPFYSQNDPAWSGDILGYGKCGSKVGPYGCHLSCIAMHYAKWGYSGMNPKELNKWSYAGESHYAFSSSGCGDLIVAYKALQYPSVCRNVREISPGQIYSELRQGHPVVVEIPYGNGSHFMVIFAFDGSRYWVKDPLRDWQHQDQPLYGSRIISVRVYGY